MPIGINAITNVSLNALAFGDVSLSHHFNDKTASTPGPDINAISQPSYEKTPSLNVSIAAHAATGIPIIDDSMIAVLLRNFEFCSHFFGMIFLGATSSSATAVHAIQIVNMTAFPIVGRLSESLISCAVA